MEGYFTSSIITLFVILVGVLIYIILNKPKGKTWKIHIKELIKKNGATIIIACCFNIGTFI